MCATGTISKDANLLQLDSKYQKPMSIGRHTLTAAMKHSWNAIRNHFRNRTGDEEQLHNDYPTDTGSEFTDDEERRREWQNHLNRRATIAAGPVTNNSHWNEDHDNMMNDLSEYESEFSVTFPSESSIIDAFKENNHDEYVNKSYVPPPFIQLPMPKNDQPYKRQLRRPGHEVHDENMHRRRMSLQPSFYRNRDNSISRSINRSPHCYPKAVVKDKVNHFERGNGKRRDSVHPQLKLGMDTVSSFSQSTVRRESSEREHDDKWEDKTTKKKIKKQIKQRKRAKNLTPNDSDAESSETESTKYTVKMTMKDLNNIIKKNISSAVKNIASVKSREAKREESPVDSFSTESETIFSGSSSHSTDASLGGLLQKQMKVQLDRDGLKGIRRTSVAAGNLKLPEPQLSPYSHPRRPSVAPLLSSFNEQQPVQVVLEDPQPLTDYQPQIPQVTFTLADNQPHQHCMMPQDSLMPPFHRPPIIPNINTMGNIDPFDSISQINSLSPSQQLFSSAMNPFHTISGFSAPLEALVPNPYHTVKSCLLPQAALNRLRTRRHTLANLGTDNPLDIDLKTDQLNNALSLLDTSIKHGENSNATKSNSPDEGKSKSDTDSKETGNKSTEQAPRPLTIAEQIAVLTNKKKPKKPLKPGQMGLTGCARALLILTNIMFLLVGGGTLGVGVWMLMDPNIETYFDILNVDNDNQDFKMICYILCSIGGSILVIGFLGCCGTIKSSKCMLTAFIIVVAVITLMEAGLGTLLVLNKDSTTAIPILSALFSELGSNMRTQLTRSLVEKYDPDTTIGAAWDLVQIEVECCGSNGPDDFKLSAWKNKTNDQDIKVPDTCCVLISKDTDNPEPSNMLLCQAGTIGFLHDTKELDASAATWNRHIIRPSGNTSVPSGRPDLMYYTPLLWNAEDHLCNVSIADFNVCREEALFRSSIPCDEDVYEMCVIIMRRDQSEPPSNFSEAVELYTHLQQDILQML